MANHNKKVSTEAYNRNQKQSGVQKVQPSVSAQTNLAWNIRITIAIIVFFLLVVVMTVNIYATSNASQSQHFQLKSALRELASTYMEPNSHMPPTSSGSAAFPILPSPTVSPGASEQTSPISPELHEPKPAEPSEQTSHMYPAQTSPEPSEQTAQASSMQIVPGYSKQVSPESPTPTSPASTSPTPSKTSRPRSSHTSPAQSASAESQASATSPITPTSPAFSETTPEVTAPGAEEVKPPRLQILNPYDEPLFKRSYPEPDKVAYITIDDGPSRAITPGILDILKQEGIKATFFVLPHSDVDDIYMRIIDEGHELGNHSYSHVYKKLYDSKDIELFREDVLLARAFIMDNFGYLTTAFRFPGGAMSRSSSIITPRREILTELGYRDFDWNVELGDANSKQADKSAEALTRNVLDNTRNREQLIVLMHDTSNKTTTLEALPFIIEGLREQGYAFDILQNYITSERQN